MIERVVENWLTSTNERGYEIPFCQYLISKGYTILGLSFHGQMEQGKDIIALDEKGVPCAFQLKTGDISESVWRTIKDEIDALIEIPIKYPLVDKKLKNRCILVTNGRITDKVRTDIDDRNLRYKQLGLPQLEIILGQELLTRFLEVHGTFLPRKVSDLKTFLELLLSDGRELLNKKMFAGFLESVLFTEGESESELRRKVASSVLLSQYVLEPYESKMNHISIIEGWTILCSYVFGMVEKYQLKERSWSQSVNIVLEKINFQLTALKDEFFSRTNYLEGGWDGALFYKSRLTIVLGWLAAFELFNMKSSVTYKIDPRIYDSIKKYYGTATWLWGESATPFFIMMSKVANEIGDTTLSNKIVCDLIIDIVTKNSPQERNALPDPYYSVKQVLNHFYGPPEEKIDLSSFSGSSYHLATLVDILVRKNRRDLLNETWKNISYILKSEFKPKSPWENFKWHCDDGEHIEAFYKRPQSWKELQESAFEMSQLEMPKILIKNPFSHYFLVCYPHRLNRSTGKLMD